MIDITEQDIERLKKVETKYCEYTTLNKGVLTILLSKIQELNEALKHYAESCFCSYDGLEHFPDCEARIAKAAILKEKP